MKKQYDLHCNIAQSLNLIGSRWTLLLLHAVKEGKQTYKELEEELKNIPTNLLSSRLKELCENGLLNCELYQTHPPRYKYTLTDKSADLDDVFYAIMIWGNKHLDTSYKCLEHESCHGTIEIAYVCSKCHEMIDKNDLMISPLKHEKDQ